jgi:molybdopterin synthase catalytic subunit
MLRVTREDFSVDEIIQRVRTKDAGAIVTFVGVVRGESDGKNVDKLDFQAYNEMAIAELGRIRDAACQRFHVNKVAIVHRTGSLNVGDNILVIAVSAPHRDEAFKACRFVLEELKETVPIWKKEFTTEGARWVKGETREKEG